MRGAIGGRRPSSYLPGRQPRSGTPHIARRPCPHCPRSPGPAGPRRTSSGAEHDLRHEERQQNVRQARAAHHVQPLTGSSAAEQRHDVAATADEHATLLRMTSVSPGWLGSFSRRPPPMIESRLLDLARCPGQDAAARTSRSIHSTSTCAYVARHHHRPGQALSATCPAISVRKSFSATPGACSGPRRTGTCGGASPCQRLAQRARRSGCRPGCTAWTSWKSPIGDPALGRRCAAYATDSSRPRQAAPTATHGDGRPATGQRRTARPDRRLPMNRR